MVDPFNAHRLAAALFDSTAQTVFPHRQSWMRKNQGKEVARWKIR
jgi:hypothetical protein